MHLQVLVDWLMGQGWRDLAQAVLMGTAASWIALIFHELGHAVAAWLVGVRMWGIRLGTGPTIWQGRVGARAGGGGGGRGGGGWAGGARAGVRGRGRGSPPRGPPPPPPPPPRRG